MDNVVDNLLIVLHDYKYVLEVHRINVWKNFIQIVTEFILIAMIWMWKLSLWENGKTAPTKHNLNNNKNYKNNLHIRKSCGICLDEVKPQMKTFQLYECVFSSVKFFTN